MMLNWHWVRQLTQLSIYIQREGNRGEKSSYLNVISLISLGLEAEAAREERQNHVFNIRAWPLDITRT
jgi:hypothetical protein